MGEKYTICKPLLDCKIKKINIFNDGKNRALFVFTERGMRAYRIKMGQKTLTLHQKNISLKRMLLIRLF